VTQRTSEIGIRIALGAQRGSVLRLILSDGLRPAWIGLLLELAGSVFAVRLIRTMLYGTRALGWALFAEVGMVLSIVAGIACDTGVESIAFRSDAGSKDRVVALLVCANEFRSSRRQLTSTGQFSFPACHLMRNRQVTRRTVRTRGSPDFWVTGGLPATRTTLVVGRSGA